GHAAGHLHVDVDGHGQRLVVHQAHAGQPQDVGDLVRVDEHAGRPVGDDGAGELGHGDHAALDVHVGVTQAGHKVALFGLDEPRLRADAVAGIRPDVGDATAGDGDVGAGQNFAAVDIDPAAVADDGIGMLAPHRHGDEVLSHFMP